MLRRRQQRWPIESEDATKSSSTADHCSVRCYYCSLSISSPVTSRSSQSEVADMPEQCLRKHLEDLERLHFGEILTTASSSVSTVPKIRNSSFPTEKASSSWCDRSPSMRCLGDPAVSSTTTRHPTACWTLRPFRVHPGPSTIASRRPLAWCAQLDFASPSRDESNCMIISAVGTCRVLL